MRPGISPSLIAVALLVDTSLASLEASIDLSKAEGMQGEGNSVVREKDRELKVQKLTFSYGKRIPVVAQQNEAAPTVSPTTFYPTVSAFPTVTGFPTATLFPTREMEPEGGDGTKSGKKGKKGSAPDNKSDDGSDGDDQKKSGKKAKTGKKAKGKKGSDPGEDTLEPETPAPTEDGGGSPVATPNPTGGPGSTPSPTTSPTVTPVESEFVTELDLSALDAQYHSFFEDAASTWSGVIIGDLLDYTLTADDKEFSSCATPPDVVDDVYICAAAAEGDGPGGVLGIGGPESGRFVGFSILPVTGYIEIDSADIDSLVDDGRLGDFVKQQFGLVYGLGTLWEFNQLLGDDLCSYNIDTKASSEFQTLSGCKTAAVPTDPNTCMSWFEDCLQTELMTSDINVGENPLSRITIAGLEDLGYQVIYDNADPFTSDDLSPNCVCNPAAIRSKGSAFKPGAGFSPERFAGGKFGRGRVGFRPPRSPRLSKSGRAKAEAYGQKRLKANALKTTSMEKIKTKSVYLGDRVVNVFFEERGHVHIVKVRADDNDD